MCVSLGLCECECLSVCVCKWLNVYAVCEHTYVLVFESTFECLSVRACEFERMYVRVCEHTYEYLT